MNVDVVPYQESTGGGKAGGNALWNKFIGAGIELGAQYICMITPSR